MADHIVNIRPSGYPTQGEGYCGGYTIKAVLSAWGLDHKSHPMEYASFPLRLARKTIPLKALEITLPYTIISQLRKYGFNASMKKANKLSDKEKIELLKKEIDENHPVIILENMGSTRKNKFYKKPFSKDIGHWISIWGYNDKEFYVYDSYVDQEYHSKVPIGNAKRSYRKILRLWKGPVGFKFYSYIYIPVVKK